MKKLFTVLLSLTLFIPLVPCGCARYEASDLRNSGVFIKPNTLIQKRTPEDKKTWLHIKKSGLLFEKDDRTLRQMASDILLSSNPYEASRLKVKENLIKNHGGEELLIDDTISALLFVRPEAPVTFVYATGYFGEQTPTKEWLAPFIALFPDCNIIGFDWPGHGDSSGTFTPDAYMAINTVLAYAQQHPVLSQTKLVVQGFCLGGALVLKALDHAQKNNLALPDALTISCTPHKIHHVHSPGRIDPLLPNRTLKLIAKVPPLKKYGLNYFLEKEIQALETDKLLNNITVPCNFEYCTDRLDKFAPLTDGYINYLSAYNAPSRNLIVSECSMHVRLQKDTPVQYRNAHIDFLHTSNIITAEQAHKMYQVSLIEELEKKQCKAVEA